MEQKFKVGDHIKNAYGKIFKITKITNCYFWFEELAAFGDGEKGRCQFGKNGYRLASTEDVERISKKIALQKERRGAAIKLKQVTKKLDQEVSYYSCQYLKTQQMIEISEFLEEKLKDIVHD